MVRVVFISTHISKYEHTLINFTSLLRALDMEMLCTLIMHRSDRILFTVIVLLTFSVWASGCVFFKLDA